MILDLYQVDAFTSQLFGGNPAAICPVEEWLPAEKMQQIAVENNLAETAFILPTEKGFYIRWFTPAIEVDLCGHATLAAAHTLFTELGYEGNRIEFDSRSGILTVEKSDNQYTMNFPTDILRKVDTPKQIVEGLGIEPLEVYKGKDDYLAILTDQKAIEELRPDFNQIAQLNSRGLICSALGDSVDFVSRCFFPAAGINEDPVTGSAHTTMTPYWAKKLDKTTLSATQLSARRGQLQCEYLGERVNLSGQAVTYLKGKIFV